MAAPVSHNTVAAVRSVPATAVTYDGMIGNLFGHRNLIDCHNETVVRGQGVHAVGKTLHLQRSRVRGKCFAHGLADCEQYRWRFDQHRADAPDPITGQVATTTWR